jgi:DNA helicase II / ATP-dependent DNA helicase PcrA
VPAPFTPAQANAVVRPPEPLVVLGGAGTGKTHVLAHRVAHLADATGTDPSVVLALAATAAGADDLRDRIDTAWARPYEELSVLTPHAFAARLLAREAAVAGLDPMVATAGSADRLSLLLERVDELPIRTHDFRGRPTAMLTAVLARIDRCKDELIGADAYAAWAATLPEDTDAARARAAHEREFALLYAAHDRMLAGEGLLDAGELIRRAHDLLVSRPDVRARAAERYPHVVADDWQDASYATTRLIAVLAAEHGSLTVAGDDDQTLARFRGAGAKNLRDVTQWFADVEVVRLAASARCAAPILEAAEAVVAPIEGRIATAPASERPGSVWFWRCANERAQAQSAAAEIERLMREGSSPRDIAVLVRSVRREGQAIAVALEERAVPYRLVGATAFFQHAEIRDLLAWLRLLADPGDAGAVVRALSRPPIQLHSVDLARCVQIARRRKLDMVSALGAATESPQVPPEARERIVAFLKLHRAAEGALDTSRPDLFVHRLIDRLGLRRQQLFSAQADVGERLVHLARFGELAAGFTNRMPQATPREFARYIAAVAETGLRDDEDETTGGPRVDAVTVTAMHAAHGGEWDHVLVLGLQASRMPGARQQVAEPIADALLPEALPPDTRERHVDAMRRLLHVAMTRARSSVTLAYAAEAGDAAQPARQPPSAFAEEARAAVGGEWEDRGEELFGPAETLHATFAALRDELISSIPQVGSRLAELRLDTDLDVNHGTARYLELLKLSALMDRTQGSGQAIEEALAQVNETILRSATAEQKEILLSSPLDELILAADRDARGRAQIVAARQEPSLEAFLPRKGDGLLLSASDIDTYRTCPLKYKFARVFRIPQEPTLNQRFGILVHQVLERFHVNELRTGEDMDALLEAGWRRGGFGDSPEERQLHVKARGALARYLDRFRDEPGEPVWFERSFSFTLGPHVLRGRVDRVDRHPDGVFELIDYKTGRPRSAAQLREDVQLSLYAVGAREAWDLEASEQSYHYVLDDEKVRVPTEDMDRDWIAETVFTVADGILSQGFEPTPSYAACSMCDFRIACPAAER